MSLCLQSQSAFVLLSAVDQCLRTRLEMEENVPLNSTKMLVRFMYSKAKVKFPRSSPLILSMIGTRSRKIFLQKLLIQFASKSSLVTMEPSSHTVRLVQERHSQLLVFLKIPSSKVLCQELSTTYSSLLRWTPRSNTWSVYLILKFTMKRLETC